MYIQACKRRIFLLLTLLTALSSCSDHHVKPDTDYYTKYVPKDTLRVAFDQNGHIYPVLSEDWDWNEPSGRFCFSTKGCAYKIMNLKDGAQKYVYSPLVDRDHYNDIIIRDLNKLLEEKESLVVLIHGFNNTYDEASKLYDTFKSRIKRSENSLDSSVILEVYWDGMSRSIPSIWFSALTYSNLAGQIGLRPILNGIEKPADIVFVTHSRGAAVAMSAISDPIYDNHICAPQEEKTLSVCMPDVCEDKKHRPDINLCSVDENSECMTHVFLGYERPKLENMKTVTFVMYAPAIGNGHFWSGVGKYLPEDKVTSFYLGNNTKDFATSKSIAPNTAFGDTSLGSDIARTEEVINMYSDQKENVHIDALWFKHGSEHSIEDSTGDGYFSPLNGDMPDCMLWAAGLITKKPDCCRLLPARGK